MIGAPMGPQKTKAAGVGTEATLKNTDLNYMPLCNLVAANLKGQRLAGIFLEDLHSRFADPDTLYLAVTALLSDGQDIEALTALRGFCRVCQKKLERSAA